MKKEVEGMRDREPHLKDYLHVLFVRRWILLSTIVVVLSAVAAFVFVTTPAYRASSLLLIEPANPTFTDFKAVYDPSMSDGDFNRRTFLETQYQLVLSRPLLERTFHHFRFGRTDRFRDAQDPIAEFERCFLVKPVKRTRLVEVCFEWEDPELAAKVLEYHVDEYLADYRKRRLGVSEDGLSALRDKAEELKPEVEAKAQILHRFMVQNNMVSFEKTQDIVVERMKAINHNLTEVEGRRIQAESRYRNIAGALEANRPIEQMPEIIQSETIRDLKLEYIRAKQALQDLDNRFGPNHPEVLAATATVQSVEEKMKSEVEHVLASAESEYERALKQEKELTESLDEQQQAVMAFNEKSVAYDILKKDYEALNRTYCAVTERIEEIEIAIAAGNKEDNIFVIAKPRIPTKTVKPKKLLSLILGAVVGLLLGVGLAFFFEYLDTTIKTKEDAERILGVPVVGYVPAIDGGRGDKGSRAAGLVELAALERPQSPAAEAFRSIRTALAFSAGGKGLKTMLLTSAVPMEGKTLVSLNLAMALASAGKKVLLVDGDMRKPRLTRLVDPEPRHGLSSLLIQSPGATLPTAVRPVIMENLHVLPCGPLPPNPAELLENETMGRLLAFMSDKYDHVLFDTPPVVTATDAAVLCRRVERAVLVVRTYSTQRESARRAVEILSSVPGKLMGIILNNADAPAAGPYGYGGYYYGYYEHSEEKRKEGKAPHPGEGGLLHPETPAPSCGLEKSS